MDIFEGGAEIVKHLIQSGMCNINAQNIYGYTVLIVAAVRGETEVIMHILQKDRNSINVQFVVGEMTALMVACMFSKGEIVELLIRSGANVYLNNKCTKTAFQLLDKIGICLSQEVKTYLKDLPRLVRQQ